MVPSRSAIPSKCHFLLEWYEREYAPRRTLGPAADPLLAPRGSDRELWAEEHAGEYVRRLREGWDLFDFTPDAEGTERGLCISLARPWTSAE